MDPVVTETTEAPVAEAKVTEKVVEDVEDTPVVASGEETETATPVEEAAPEEEKKTPAVVESKEDAVEVTENGNGEAAEVVEPVVEEADESIKRKAVDEEPVEVPEKKAKTDEPEAEVVEEVTA